MSLEEGSRPPPAPASLAVDSDYPTTTSEDLPLVATGLGGRVEFRNGEIRIIKNSAIGHVIDLLLTTYGVMEKRIPLSHVTSIEIVRPLVFPDFFRVTYAGSPPQTGKYLRDALAENAVMMNMFDNRAFYDVRDRIARSTSAGRPEASQA